MFIGKINSSAFERFLKEEGCAYEKINVSVIDTGTNSVIATVTVGNQPFDIAITPPSATTRLLVS